MSNKLDNVLMKENIRNTIEITPAGGLAFGL